MRLLNLREIVTHRLRVATSLSVIVVASALLVAVFGGRPWLLRFFDQIRFFPVEAAELERIRSRWCGTRPRIGCTSRKR